MFISPFILLLKIVTMQCSVEDNNEIDSFMVSKQFFLKILTKYHFEQNPLLHCFRVKKIGKMSLSPYRTS